MVGKLVIQQWLLKHDVKNLPDDIAEMEYNLVGPVLHEPSGYDCRTGICYDTSYMEMFANNEMGVVKRAEMDNALPFRVWETMSSPDGKLHFAGDDTSVTSFLTFDELDTWLTEHGCPLSVEWTPLDQCESTDEDTPQAE